jgi:hypothetical protein
VAEVKITFPVSRAVIYPSVVRLAEKFGMAFVAASDAEPLNSVVFASENLDSVTIKKIQKLWKMVKPVKGSSFTIDGSSSFMLESNLSGVTSCMKDYDYAEDQEAYCNGAEGKPSQTFGCRQLSGISSDHKLPNAMIFTGRFVSRNVQSLLDPEGKAWKNAPKPMPFSLFAKKTDKGWVIDPVKIKAKARDLAKGKACQMCPHFSWDRVDQAIELKCVTAPALFSAMSIREIYGLDVKVGDFDDGFSNSD